MKGSSALPTSVDGEQMGIRRDGIRDKCGVRVTKAARLWWRPAGCSALAVAAIAALFAPVPAFAGPTAAKPPAAGPEATGANAATNAVVPDAGTRPLSVGSLFLPGQRVPTTSVLATTGSGVPLSPQLQKVQQGRTEIATLGDQLIQLGQGRDLATNQLTTAKQVYSEAVVALGQAQTDADESASAVLRDAAALPPGGLDPDLRGLGDLARAQRGGGASSTAAARQLNVAQTAARLALEQLTSTGTRVTTLIDQYTKLNATITKKQAAQQQLEQTNADLLTASDTTETAADRALGKQYLTGADAGRGADPRAIQALQFALAQRGKPYVWATEGPDTYDCSGLVWRAYQQAGLQLERVARDQYWQTRLKVVDRYSLLPGDLLFYSYSNSWLDIHHIAMYAGNGMMVEAPRTGLTVRLVPVRWSELFQATRVVGSIEGTTPVPDPGAPATGIPKQTPAPTTAPPASPGPSTKPPASPVPTGSPTKTPPPTTKPTTAPSPSPSPAPTTPAPTPNPTTPPETTPPSSPTETNAPTVSPTSGGTDPTPSGS